MIDYISRADAMGAVQDHFNDNGFWGYDDGQKMMDRIKALPSADAESDDLIIKGAKGIQDGLYNIKDGKLFMYKANGGTVRTYPIVPSADAVPKWNCTANFVAEQLDRLRNMTDEERWDFFIKFFSPSADRPTEDYSDLPDIPRAYYEKIVGNMAHEINMLKEQLESADAVHGYTEWLEKIIVDNEGANEWLCEDTPDLEWCENNCHYSSIQAECLRHLYEVSKGGDSE